MTFLAELPNIGIGNTTVPIEIGNVTFVLGPNGSGKSSLMHRLYTMNANNSRRVTAHRQSWMSSNASEFAPSQIAQQLDTARQQDSMPNGRYVEWQSQARPAYLIYELLAAENMRARQIANLATESKLDDAGRLAKSLGPLQRISELLQRSNMPINISANENDALVASKNGGGAYSIAALSDGERNALQIAGHVILARPGSLILIDEPERHLHQSIMTPFLHQLFALRPDCAFVISSHNLDLPNDHPTASGVLVRECQMNGDTVVGWSIDVARPIGELDEQIRVDVLGGRRKILFIEGSSNSLDAPLYSIMAPSVLVKAIGNCREVISHTNSINSSDFIHWAKAYGIVDRDQLVAEELSELESKSIYAIGCYSVESIYYHAEIQKLTCEALCRVTGADATQLIAAARTVGLDAVRPHAERMSARLIERRIRTKLLAAAPSWKDIPAHPRISVEIDAQVDLAAERAIFDNLIATEDLDGLIKRYPIRETDLISKVVNALQFKNRGQYEAAALRVIKDEPAAKQLVSGLFEGALAKIEN